MKTIRINGKGLLGYNMKDVIKEVRNCSVLGKEFILTYDDISKVYLLFSIEGWEYYKQFNFIHYIEKINCKDYYKLSLKKIKELIFDKEE